MRVEGSGEMINGRDEEGRGAGRRFSLGKSKVGGWEKKRDGRKCGATMKARGCLREKECEKNIKDTGNDESNVKNYFGKVLQCSTEESSFLKG